tara:strand:+ start:119 stop:415 length:297 start_codon:yes stop_codon:yes gene_type:complete
MPAEKGIPKPEFNCYKLDKRVYDSRTTWGWVSDDRRYVINHDGEVYYRMDPVDLKWDKDNPELNITVHRIDALRMIRWIRHANEMLGNVDPSSIQHLE